MIAIIDYGMGNVGSIQNMLAWIGVDACISADPDIIRSAGKLILPGVGAFDTGISRLNDLGFTSLLNELVIDGGKPLLGICLGMQLLGQRSEEGSLPGLGWLDAESVRFRFEPAQPVLKVPHMGWNRVDAVAESPLFAGIAAPRFYFVHSYHLVCRNREDILACADYGFRFNAAVQRKNIYGVQFHPEKSHKFGMALLRNFAERC